MTREVRRRVTVQPGGRIELQAEELPAGVEAEVVVTVNGNGAALPNLSKNLTFKEQILRTLPELDMWVHHGEVRTKIRGTGLEVWEIINGYVEMDRDFGKLVTVYHWLSFEQPRQCLVYAHIFPEEIAEHVRRNFAVLPDDPRPDPLPSWP
jgi:uncharacterized protein (DUF433 family)